MVGIKRSVLFGVISVLLLFLLSSCSSVDQGNSEMREVKDDATGEPPLGDMAAQDRADQLKQKPSSQVLPPIDSGLDGQFLANGPYNDRLLFSTSFDGASWDSSYDIITSHASVPDAMILEQDVGEFSSGDIYSVFVDARELVNGPGNEKIGMIVSSDQGSSWSEVTVLNVVGSENHVAVDPSIVQLDDGTLLLYYFDFTVKMNPLIDAKKEGLEYVMYVASSENGISFDLLGEAYISDKSITDPEVVYFDDKWLMFVAQDDGMQLLVGEDPYSFSFHSDIDILGIPGTVIVDEELWLYGCDSSGMIPWVSADGLSFEKSDLFGKSNTPGIPACDPAPLYFDDGSFGLIAKAFPAGE